MSLPPCLPQLSVVTQVAAAPRESARMTIPPAAASIKIRVLPLQVFLTAGLGLRVLVSRKYHTYLHDLNYHTGIDYYIASLLSSCTLLYPQHIALEQP